MKKHEKGLNFDRNRFFTWNLPEGNIERLEGFNLLEGWKVVKYLDIDL